MCLLPGRSDHFSSPFEEYLKTLIQFSTGRVKTLHRNHLFFVKHQDSEDGKTDSEINTENEAKIEEIVKDADKVETENPNVEDGSSRFDATKDQSDKDSNEETGYLLITRSLDAHNPVESENEIDNGRRNERLNFNFNYFRSGKYIYI